MKKLMTMAVAAMIATMTLTSCSQDDNEIRIIPAPEEPVVLNCAKPDYLKAGDKVALISPSYFTPMETIEKAAEVFHSWGFETVIGPNIDKVLDGKLGGTVEERISDIRWALVDPSIKAIFCNRGGYGTIQLIDQLPFDEVKAGRKWMIGFSDISTLHGFWNRAGVMSMHATMGTFLAKGGTDVTSTMMRDLLLGKVPRYEIPAHEKNIIGRGEFTDCGKDFTDENGDVISNEKMLHDLLAEYHIPVLCGFPAGHDDINLPLVMGAPVTIDVRTDGATLQFDIDGEQQIVNTEQL
jgi:muramoyltetrapeptide carboxypeptidase